MRPTDGDDASVARDAAETTVVSLRLDLATETISGTLADEQGRERPFWGWLELSAALDERRCEDARLDDPAPTLDRGSEN
jgi:hypothetical protein